MSPLNLPIKIDFSPSKNRALIENSIIIAFVFFGFVGILHHEIWRDEFQAWLLARDSGSPIELFQNMRYEGHPGLWHLCLYGLSRITHNPVIMQIFHLFISAVIVGLIVKFFPFYPPQKFLLSFGYYFFYEYTIISRNYNLGVLFVVLFCIAYSKSKVKPILLATLLALMANTNALAFILSFAFSLTLIDDFYSRLKANKLQRQKLFISLFILISGWGISFLQIIRPLIPQQQVIRPMQSSVEQSPVNPGILEEIKSLGNAVAGIWRSYVPIPFHFNDDFWNTNILVHNTILPSIAGVPLGAILAALGSVVLLLISIKILSQKRLILTIYLFGTGSIIAFNHLIFQGVMRHRGYLFILLIACLWLLEKELSSWREQTPKQKDKNRFGGQFLTAILCLHFLGGFHAYTIDLFYPFSAGRETAQYIRDNNLDQLKIVGQRYRQAAVFSGYLDRPIYDPDRGKFASFWTVETKMKDIETVEGLIRDNPDKTLLILTYELEPDVFPPDLKITEVERFVRPTIERFERAFYLYTAQEIDPVQNN